MTRRWITIVVVGALLLAMMVARVTRRRSPISSRTPTLTPQHGPIAPSPEPTPEPSTPVPPPAAKAPEPAEPPPSAAEVDDEVAFMHQLRLAAESDPARALDLARDGERRFPDGADAAERSTILIKSLAKQGRMSEARGEAEKMVAHYAGTPWAVEVEKQTGAHPRVDH
jgi:hypothetical protein